MQESEERSAVAVGAQVPPGAPPVLSRGYHARMLARYATGSLRALPDFLILGGQRCGSTSLYAMLCDHPQVMAASQKEPHFFDRHHLRGERFYRRIFPLRVHMWARGRATGRRMVTGEATTHSLSSPVVPGRVGRMLPDVRLIAILRDPVERAHSAYQLAVRNGREPRGVEQALEAEDERLAGEEERMLADPGYSGPAHGLQSYRTRGLYLDQLERWWAVAPPERLLVLRSEDMFADPRRVYDEAVAFLGLKRDPVTREFPVRNRASYSSMHPDTRASLRRFYAEPNRRLEERLGRRMNWQAPDS